MKIVPADKSNLYEDKDVKEYNNVSQANFVLPIQVVLNVLLVNVVHNKDYHYIIEGVVILRFLL